MKRVLAGLLAACGTSYPDYPDAAPDASGPSDAQHCTVQAECGGFSGGFPGGVACFAVAYDDAGRCFTVCARGNLYAACDAGICAFAAFPDWYICWEGMP